MAMYYYARKLQKSARKIKTTPQQQTPITANGSVPGCTSIISTGIVSGPGAGVGCTSPAVQLNQSSLSPGSSDSGQQQQSQNQPPLQLSVQNLSLECGGSGGTPGAGVSGIATGSGNGSISYPNPQQHSSRPPIPSCLSAPNPLLQKEWEKTGLVFQDSNLVSGTLDALIRHLVPTPEYYPDRAFIFAFLLSSRLHIRPHELLGTVFRLAFAVPTSSASTSTSTSTTTNYQQEDQIKIVARIVQLLGEWAELFPYDFRDDKMMSHVRAITQKCVSIDPPVRKDVSLLLTSLLARLTALEKYEALLHKIAVETPPESQAVTAPSILAICPDPNLLAEQLTHIELERLSHIGPEEFVQAFVKEIGVTSPATAGAAATTSASTASGASSSSSATNPVVNGMNGGGVATNGSISGSTVSSSSDGLLRPGTSSANPATTAPQSSNSNGSGTSCSSSVNTSGTGNGAATSTSKESRKTRNLESYVKWFNRLCYIISSDVCKATKKKLRIRYIEYWVEVAKECFNIGNFNSLMAIITGLNMSPVLRMKKTWGKVNCDLLSSLEQHMDPSSNFASYRSLLRSVVWHTTNPSADTRAKTVIPFFSLLIKDLYFLHQGCASRLPNGHINFEKCWQLAKQVTELMTWQQVQCPFPKVPTIITSIQTIPALSENALLLASFECEPPETPEEKERLKQLQDEANLLLQMTNEAVHHHLLLPSTSSSASSGAAPLPIVPPLPIYFQPLPPAFQQLPQPYVFVSSADSTIPALFLEHGSTQAEIQAAHFLHPQLPLLSPPGTVESSSSQQDEEDNESGLGADGQLPLPPPPS